MTFVNRDSHASWLLIVCQFPDTEIPTFLTEDEWLFVIEALREDYKGQPTHFSVQFIWQALRDWKTYASALIYFWSVVPLILFIFVDLIIDFTAH